MLDVSLLQVDKIKLVYKETKKEDQVWPERRHINVLVVVLMRNRGG